MALCCSRGSRARWKYSSAPVSLYQMYLSVSVTMNWLERWEWKLCSPCRYDRLLWPVPVISGIRENPSTPSGIGRWAKSRIVGRMSLSSARVLLRIGVVGQTFFPVRMRRGIWVLPSYRRRRCLKKHFIARMSLSSARVLLRIGVVGQTFFPVRMRRGIWVLPSYRRRRCLKKHFIAFSDSAFLIAFSCHFSYA